VHDLIVAHPEFFIRWPNGSVCEMPYEEHGTGGPVNNCSWPIRAAAYDFSQAAVRAWFLDNIVAPTLVVADGVWLDGDGPDNGAWMCSGSYDFYPVNKLPAPYPPINASAIAAFCAGEAQVAADTNAYLAAHGGFNYECLSFVSRPSQLPQRGDSAAACAAKMSALAARAGEPTVVYGDRTHGQGYTDANATAAVAVFLVTRGPQWWFGAPAADALNATTAALLLSDFGAALGNATVDGAVYTRQYERATVTFDCGGLEGRILDSGEGGGA
jgi:hypothetical protein